MTSIAQAIALHQAGDIAAAEPVYRQVLEEDPEDFDALHLLGLILSGRGRRRRRNG